MKAIFLAYHKRDLKAFADEIDVYIRSFTTITPIKRKASIFHNLVVEMLNDESDDFLRCFFDSPFRNILCFFPEKVIRTIIDQNQWKWFHYAIQQEGTFILKASVLIPLLLRLYEKEGSETFLEYMKTMWAHPRFASCFQLRDVVCWWKQYTGPKLPLFFLLMILRKTGYNFSNLEPVRQAAEYETIVLLRYFIVQECELTLPSIRIVSEEADFVLDSMSTLHDIIQHRNHYTCDLPTSYNPATMQLIVSGEDDQRDIHQLKMLVVHVHNRIRQMRREVVRHLEEVTRLPRDVIKFVIVPYCL